MKSLRLALYFVVGLLLGGCFTLSYAGNFQSYQGSAFRTINGTTYWKGDAGSFAQSKATVIESIKVGGTYITVPTMAQVTGGAVALATAAIRATPGMAGLGIISWLASQGLELVENEFRKKTTTPIDSGGMGQGFEWGCGSLRGELGNAFAQQCASASGWGTLSEISFVPNGLSSYIVKAKSSGFNGGPYTVATINKLTTCASGYVMSGTKCEPVQPCPPGSTRDGDNCTAYVPAGQSDWDVVNGVTPPDQVMKEMCQALAKYNTSTPGCAMYNAKTEKASVAMSDWAHNPTTGKDERQVATWTPRPTPEDPFAGEVSVKTESKDPSAPTDPETGDTTNPADTSSKDNTKDTPFCTLYPESLACAKMGTPEEADKLDSKTMGVESITIQTFGSSATCPSPIQLPHGSELSFEWPCRMAEGVKPFLLALAWLAAGLIVIGAMRND